MEEIFYANELSFLLAARLNPRMGLLRAPRLRQGVAAAEDSGCQRIVDVDQPLLDPVEEVMKARAQNAGRRTFGQRDPNLVQPLQCPVPTTEAIALPQLVQQLIGF